MISLALFHMLSFEKCSELPASLARQVKFFAVFLPTRYTQCLNSTEDEFTFHYLFFRVDIISTSIDVIDLTLSSKSAGFRMKTFLEIKISKSDSAKRERS